MEIVQEPNFRWPCDVLVRVLGLLAAEGATAPFHRLAFLTYRNEELSSRAVAMPRPLVLHVRFKLINCKFFIPFYNATIVKLEVDWGDGGELQIITKRVKSVSHVYYKPGTYRVRVFRHGEAATGPGGCSPTWLDHLGLRTAAEADPNLRGSDDGESVFKKYKRWWKPIRSFESWGNLGIRSLHALFAGAFTFNVRLPFDLERTTVDLSAMFHAATHFNRPLVWNVSNVTNMSGMFEEALTFNQPIGSWNVSKVTDMKSLFSSASRFNQPLEMWDVSSVTTMEEMFFGAKSFNHPVGNWNVSQVTNMTTMFHSALAFNQQLHKWDVSKVTEMTMMFYSAIAFNQPLGNWDVSNLTEAIGMFQRATQFNYPIGRWDVRKLTNMACMFKSATAFNQSLDAWKISEKACLDEIFDSATSFSKRPSWSER